MTVWQRIKFAVKAIFARFDAARTNSPHRSQRYYGPQDARVDFNNSNRTIIAETVKSFEYNNAVAQTIGSTFVDYTVGPQGLVLIPGSSDAAWNAAAKKYWQTACTFIDLKSRQNFGCIQGLVAWRWFFDGEIFILKTRRQNRQGRWFPAVQLIEYYCVATPPDRQKDEGKSICDGVELDASGRPTGYWVKEGAQGTVFRLVPAEDMIHVFEPSRPGQYRGISFFHAAINYLHRLDDLQELEMRAVADAAEKSTFIESATGELPPGMQGGLPQNSLGSPLSTTTQPVDVNELREVIGGRTVAIPFGSKASQFTPARPTESTRALWSYLTSCVCAAIPIPKVVCFPEWMERIQGTVVRGDYARANQFFQARSAVLAAAFREVYIYVMGWGIRSEATIADPPADWIAVTVRPPHAVDVDVGRNSRAMLDELAQGCTNYDLIYSPMGLDWQEELTKLADQVAFIQKLAAERGIDPGQIREQASVSQPEQPNPAQVDEEVVT